MFDYPLLLIFPIAMVYAAASDFLTMTIPNRVSLALIVGFFAAALMAGLGWQTILLHVGAGVLVLVIAMAMFSQGWIGGGDAKLLSAAALWFGFGQIVDYVFVTTVFGGVIGLALIMFRRAVPPVTIAGLDWAVRLHDKKTGMPYGVALGAAGLWIFPTSDMFRALSV